MRIHGTELSTAGFPLLRRDFLRRSVGGLGALALAQVLADAGARAAAPNPYAARRPHHRPRAKAVISLVQNGGPSQMDLFDPKPKLGEYHGKPYPGGELEAFFTKEMGNVLASPFEFRPHGECGMELSELLPQLGTVADELTLVRSMTTESVDHELAVNTINSGKVLDGRPVWGAWVVYGLGTERQDLPAYVALTDPGGPPVNGPLNWSAGFLPAAYQGTPFRPQGPPVLNLSTPAGLPAEGRRNQLRFLEELNRVHQRRHPENFELAARIRNYELAAEMQTSVPEVVDFSDESKETRRLYGLDRPESAEYGKRCLLARRLVERGVRFVQVFLNLQPWDTHSGNAKRLRSLAAMTDQPSAALVADLKRRGLLDSTIVLWTGEFGRLPISQGKDGRDHNRHGFSLWIAGGGFRRGYVHGATDEFGYKAVEDVVGVSDLHATLLAALGLDHERLTYHHAGRDEGLTDVDLTDARVVDEMLG